MRFRKLQQLITANQWEDHGYAYEHPNGQTSFRYNTLVWGRIGSDYNGKLRKAGTRLEDVQTLIPRRQAALAGH